MAEQCEIPALSRRNKRQREPLGAANQREAIDALRLAVAPVKADSDTAGISWPLTEIERETETIRIYDPTDAAVWVDVERILTMTVEDADGVQGQLILNPPA